MALPRVLKDLMSLPTAPFVEQLVLGYVERACRRLPGVQLKYDKHGNLLAEYRHSSPAADPVAFVAHTDHPGFIALEMVDRRTLRAAFRGGVRPEYFPKARLRFWDGKRWVKGRLTELAKAQRVRDLVGWIWRPEEVFVRVSAPVPPQAPGMWDLPEPALRNGLVTARGCDDLAGVAAMLTLLGRLSRKRVPAHTYCLFTRAEEVGFVGAIAAAGSGTIPRSVPVFSIETSSVLPNVVQGEGPIVRVGDKAAVFTPSLTAFCHRVARTLGERRRSFAYQRRLMDGGTCEAIPFLANGYQASGICLALGNYHNMDKKRGRIGSESISLSDWQRMVDLFEALVVDTGPRDDDLADMRPQLDQRYAKYAPLLHTK